MDAHITIFKQRADRFSALLDRTTDQWEAATPCEGWSVRDVVEHVVTTERDFLDRQGLDAGPEPDLSDPATAFATHVAHVVTVADDAVAAREYDGWFGPTTVGATLADFYGWDLAIHGWDVARATGASWTLDEAEVRQLGETADGWGDALHADGICGPALEVSEPASAQDRLLARLGRDPGWRPEVSATA